MLSKKETIKKIYEDILKDKRTFDRLRSELNSHSQFDESFIRKHILPLAQKIDPEITWQDILAYEKDALNQPAKLNLNDLQNISGGRASNVLLSCGLLALMGFSGVASNVASADFISFTETKEYQDYKAFKNNPSPTEDEQKKYAFVTLGEVPFYLQADHMVDGLLWFKSPGENKAFFVMDRHFNDKKEAVYTYSSDRPSQLKTTKPSFEEIQKQEFKLFNISELTGYLKESFTDADEKPFNTVDHANSQTLQLVDDNPLYNYARFYNPNFMIDSKERKAATDSAPISMNIGTKDNVTEKSFSVDEIVSTGTPQTDGNKEKSSLHKQQEDSAKKALASRESFDVLDWNEEIKKNPELLKFAKSLKEALQEQILWKIAHRTTVGWSGKPRFTTIESFKTLQKKGHPYLPNSFDIDEKNFRNTGFTFFTLQPDQNKRSKPKNLFNCKEDLAEAVIDFDNIPLVSCSTDFASAFFFSKTTPCFNGSSEEVKDQITTYYANQEIKKKLDIDHWSVETFKKQKTILINKIREQIRDDALEVRIPTKVAVNKWDILKDGFNTEDAFTIKPGQLLGFPKIGKKLSLNSNFPSRLQIKPIPFVPLSSPSTNLPLSRSFQKAVVATTNTPGFIPTTSTNFTESTQDPNSDVRQHTLPTTVPENSNGAQPESPQ